MVPRGAEVEGGCVIELWKHTQGAHRVGLCRHREIHNNILAGTVPAELGALPALKSLRMFENSLAGTVPTELGALTSLTL
ncbi:hypothetical protein CYMTET_23442, partial [Cymbomonas tetramitiformis]